MPNRNQSQNSKIRHHSRKFVLNNAFQDHIWAETVCLNTRLDVIEHLATLKNRDGDSLFPFIENGQIPDFVGDGFVLTDSRGRGALQK